MKFCTRIINKKRGRGGGRCNSVQSAYADSAKESMKNAVQEVWDIVNPNADTNDVVDSGICIDGSWQKRGHKSVNRVVTGISRENNKVLDLQVFFQVLPFMFEMGITERNTRVRKMESDSYMH